MTIAFQKATRTKTKLKIAITGPSGSGKTLGALALARTLADGGSVAVVDTENGSASLYGDKYNFDVLDLAPPFTSARYMEALIAGVEAGYSVLIVDSLSHQWQGEGSILSRKEEVDARGGNSFTNWAKFSREHTEFVGRILQLPVHLIATVRSKQDYVLEMNEKGKQMPRKVGLAPVQREGMEYEFSTVFDVQMDHRAKASKDRTGLFGDSLVDLVKPETGKKLIAWLATASAAPVDPTKATPEQIERLRYLVQHPGIDVAVRDLVKGRVAVGTVSSELAVKWIKQLEDKAGENGMTNDDSAVTRMAKAEDDATAELPF